MLLTNLKEKIFFGFLVQKLRDIFLLEMIPDWIKIYSTSEGQVADKNTMYKIGLQNFLK